MSGTIGSKSSDVPVGTISTNNVVASSVVVGANVAVNTSTISVGNSTVNTVANSSAVYISGNAVSPYTGSKNKIINGGMQIWQRGTSFSNPTNAATSYTADRWSYYRTSYTANVSASQTTSLSINGNNRNALRIQRTASDANTNGIFLVQQIESQNIRDLAGQTVTASAWVRVGANFSATYLYMSVYSGTGVDESIRDAGFTNVTLVSQIAIPSSTTTYTKFTITGTLASNINEAAVQFQYTPSGTAGANEWFEIMDVQLEAGSVATPFERRPYGMELALCQRYYEKSWNQGSFPGSSIDNTGPAFYFVGVSTTTAVGTGGGVQYKVAKRTAPTVTVYNYSGTANKVSPLDSTSSVGTTVTYNAGRSGEYGFASFNDSGSGFSAGTYYWFGWTASAEL